MKGKLLNVLEAVVSAAPVVYLSAFQVDLKRLWEVVRQARWGYPAAAVALLVVSLRAGWRVCMNCCGPRR